jgi:hypothetical protein
MSKTSGTERFLGLTQAERRLKYSGVMNTPRKPELTGEEFVTAVQKRIKEKTAEAKRVGNERAPLRNSSRPGN